MKFQEHYNDIHEKGASACADDYSSLACISPSCGNVKSYGLFITYYIGVREGPNHGLS